MNIDRRAIKPFNSWWHGVMKYHCGPSEIAIEAFAAGFESGMRLAVEEATAIINGSQTKPSGDAK